MAEERTPVPPLLAGRWVPSLHDDDIAGLVGTHERGRAEPAARATPEAPPGRDPAAESMLGALALLHVPASVTFEHLCRVNRLLGPAVAEFTAHSGPQAAREVADRTAADGTAADRTAAAARTAAIPAFVTHRDLLVAIGEPRSRRKSVEHAAGFLVRAGRDVHVPETRRRPGLRSRSLRHRLGGLEPARRPGLHR